VVCGQSRGPLHFILVQDEDVALIIEVVETSSFFPVANEEGPTFYNLFGPTDHSQNFRSFA
jgi:hypothetical protein